MMVFVFVAVIAVVGFVVSALALFFGVAYLLASKGMDE
jgi:hypothetical protein